MSRIILAAPILLSLVFRADTLHAQSVAGKVLEAGTERAVVAADVRLLGPRDKVMARTSTDTAGYFELEARYEGRYRLQVAALGYAEARSRDFALGAGELVEVRFLVDAAALMLAPLTVTARSHPPSRYLVDSGFYDREKSGIGTFLTREEIVASAARRFTELLHRLPGVHLDPEWSDTRPRMSFGRSAGRCQPKLFLDGVPAATTVRMRAGRLDLPLDDIISVDDLDGLEVYKGASEVPLEFGGEAAGCGALVVWTRRR